MSAPEPMALPAHYELTRTQLVFSALSIAAAFLLLLLVGSRVVLGIDVVAWWVPLAVVAGLTAADFASGLVHWAADTWGRDDYPLIGHRLLVPFRVHHVNPDDFLRRRFVDTNGDVAFLAIPVLLALGAVPLDSVWGAPVAVFGLAFCGIGSLTNQIHQWAHMPRPPRVVAALQSARVLLGRAEHARHHARPYDCRYCITTGWCNRPLEALGFFRRLEAAITRVSGVTPRHDDRRYEALRQRSGQALRQGSGQALRQGSGQALRQRSGQALRQGSGQALRQGSGQALRQGSGQALRHGSGQALRLRSGQARVANHE